MSMFSLKGRVALVTGASRGLGLGLAQQLLARGHRLLTLQRTLTLSQSKRITWINALLELLWPKLLGQVRFHACYIRQRRISSFTIRLLLFVLNIEHLFLNISSITRCTCLSISSILSCLTTHISS